ncbi:hypothetical protein P154DRAFT_571952 [Amniculicola lignicola CBS 123094]|uniref:Rhodopsin domain-containing protein n=1 Tax=Amniculicola lignicola CBS 123094 TaxID=1392246 RepID=A0A6A5WVH9_9PLEO|nr:hypothetical protein P154DRAFT_571952 [Amniculicola lignicola CBS 123094]
MSTHIAPTAEDAASWPAPNYVNPETRRPLVLGIQIPLMILVLSFTTMRFYSRTILIKALGADDWFMLVAAVFSVGVSVMTSVSTDKSIQTGYHLWDLSPTIAQDPGVSEQIAMATQLLFVPVAAFTKISILITYLRIFPSKTNLWFCRILLVFTVAWSFVSFFLALLQCMPVQAIWSSTKYPNAKCLNVAIVYYTSGCLNILSDFLIFLWPAKDLWEIRISRKQRVILISMFSLGVVVCVAGACRVYYIYKFIQSYDAFYTGATLYAVGAIETSLAIVCGCLPACKPLLSQVLPSVFGTSQSSTHRPTHQKGSKLGGQSFPFQTLSGGIMKEEGYSVEHEVAGKYTGQGPSTNVTVSRSKVDEEDDADSQEWIMLQDGIREGIREGEGSGDRAAHTGKNIV